MRIGRCETIDRGVLAVVEGIAIFEALRVAVVNQAFQELGAKSAFCTKQWSVMSG